MTKQEQFAYSAGLLDGEGCFHASRNEHCNTFRYGITVNLDFEKPLQRLKGLFGGEVKPRSDGGFSWAIPKHLLGKCLDAVIPYLLIKRKQAELVRELRMTFVDTGRKRGQRPPDEVVSFRQELTTEITRLKEEYSLKPIPVLPKACLHAYTAGILDAEGSFGIYHGQGNRFVAKAQIGMVDPTAVTAIHNEFEGFVQIGSKGHAHPVNYAVFERGAAVQISKKTRKYRLLKIEQGDLVVRLQNHIDLWQGKRHGNIPHPEHVIAQRERWYQRSRELNSITLAARAETNPSQPLVASDSPICIEPKDAELPEMSSHYAAA
jgi:hypothetical protein